MMKQFGIYDNDRHQFWCNNGEAYTHDITEADRYELAEACSAANSDPALAIIQILDEPKN